MSDESKLGWEYKRGKLAIGELPDMDELAYHAEATEATAGELAAIEAAAKSKPSEPYGDVNYGDPGYRDGKKRYPLSSPEKIRAAWSYIHMPKNADKYTPAQLAHIKGKIVSAWKAKIDPKGPPEAK
jgi:hypothetical protein